MNELLMIAAAALAAAGPAEPLSCGQQSEKVFDAATSVCPAAWESDSFTIFVHDYAEKSHYSPAEETLLLNYCRVYGQGHYEGLRSSQVREPAPGSP